MACVGDYNTHTDRHTQNRQAPRYRRNLADLPKLKFPPITVNSLKVKMQTNW